MPAAAAALPRPEVEGGFPLMLKCSELRILQEQQRDEGCV